MANHFVLQAGAALLLLQVADVALDILGVPGGLSATASAATIRLSWSATTGATSYVVQRSPNGSTGWTTVGTPTVPSYVDTGLSASATYFYRVQAVGDGGATSNYSGVVQATTPAASGVLAAPVATATTYGAARIDLSWTASGEATSYQVERSVNGGTDWTRLGALAGTRYADTGLSAATAYAYRVRAVNGGVTSAPSAIATAATTAAGRPNANIDVYGGTGYVPSRPIEFSVVPFSASVINMSWNKRAGSSYFVVQRSTDDVNWATIAVTDTAPYSDTGLPPSTSYFYRVLGGNPYGEVLHGDINSGSEAAQTTYAAGAPTIPAYHGLAAAPMSPTSVQVRWLQVQAPEGVEASNYLVERSSDGGSTWTQVASQSATVFTDTGLTAATAYSYRFRAVGAGGTSAPSSVVSITTLPNRTGRALFQPRDFTYVGSFQPPFYVTPQGNPPAGADIRSSFSQAGIAMRRVNGELRFFSLTNAAQINTNQFLYEFTPPATLARSAPFPAGSPVKYWGDPYMGKKLGFQNTNFDEFGSTILVDKSGVSTGFTSSGVFMDPVVVNRIWITYGDFYNVGGANSPVVLYCDLDDDAGIITTTGPFRFNDKLPGVPDVQKTKAGIGAVPQWFADRSLNVGGAGSTGDSWRMAGYGGNEAGAGLASFGPSIVTFNTARLTGKACAAGQIGQAKDLGIFVVEGDTATPTPLIESTSLMGYLYNLQWCTKPPGFVGRGNVGGIKSDTANAGYFYTTDRIKGGLCWIDDDAGTRSKHGVLVAGVFGHGYSVYKAGNVLTGGTVGGPTVDGGQAFGFTIVDPADLAAVAAGSLGMGQVPVKPGCWWLPEFYGADTRTVPYIGNFGVDTSVSVNGMEFDPTTNRLYLCVGAGPGGSGHGEPTPIIHVYDVAP